MLIKNKNYSDVVSKREKFFFALGDFFGGGSGLFISVLYFRFLTDVLLIPPGISGMVVMLTRIWDAVIDPVIGVISDNTRTRWGRRRPGIFVGGLLIVFALTFMFMPIVEWSTAGKAVYVIISWILYSTVASYIAINYAALSGEISNDYRQRNTANTMRLAISQIATLICATVPMLIRDALEPSVGIYNAYLVVAIIFGLIFGLVVILVAVFTKERTPIPTEKIKFDYKIFIEPLKLKSFRQLMLMYTFAFLTLDIVTTLFQHFMEYVAHRPAETSFVLGALIGTQILTIPLVYFLVKRYPKPTIFRLSVPIWILGALALSTYSASWPPVLIYIFAAFTGIGVCAVVMMPWLIFPDVVDVGELALGRRDTGSFSGVMVLLRQISSAVGIAAVGWVMEFTGFDPLLGTYGQPDSAIAGFRALIIVSAVFFLGIAFYGSTRIKMNEARATTVKDALILTREGKPLTPELEAAVAALKPDLIG